MWFVPVTGIACAAAFAALALLTALRGRPSRQGTAVIVACCLTAGWGLLAAFDGFGLPGLVPVLESAQTLAWLGFVAMLLMPGGPAEDLGRLRWIAAGAAVAAGLAVLLGDLLNVAAASSPYALDTGQLLGRECLAIAGLLMAENLYRNTPDRRLWNVVPLCIAVGGIFAYQLFLASDALLSGRVNTVFAAARPAATFLVLPFLAVTLARNRDWRVDIHVSRQVVLHSLTLMASGVFLLAVAGVGTVLEEVGGGWGPLIQVTSLFGSLLVLATVLSSQSVKARLKYLISRNFFSLRYDYRVEWMKFIDVLSAQDAGEDVKRRVVNAVADIVDSPGGVLWLLVEGTGYLPAVQWEADCPVGVVEPIDSAFVTGFRGGTWIQEMDRQAVESAPSWRDDDSWLAVPLTHQERMIGFIILQAPRLSLALNWESFELLRAVARQAASYISEARAAQRLADAEHLQEYGKRFTFVAHDIKNLTGQLGLLVVNAQRHGDNPAFQADLLRTIEGSVARMNRLLQRLKANQLAAETVPVIDPRPVIAEVAGNVARVRISLAGGSVAVRIDPDGLRSALTHLLDNALEASGTDGAVLLHTDCREGRLVVDITDQGTGMDAEFIHDRLFRPFHSTKSSGFGIGAYQTRELIRQAGGELEVISRRGAGTTMRIVLPLASEAAVSSAA